MLYGETTVLSSQNYTEYINILFGDKRGDCSTETGGTYKNQYV